MTRLRALLDAVLPLLPWWRHRQCESHERTCYECVASDRYFGRARAGLTRRDHHLPPGPARTQEDVRREDGPWDEPVCMQSGAARGSGACLAASSGACAYCAVEPVLAKEVSR